MGKLKTQKAVTKRFKLTKTGKLLKKVAGQGHFNSRESGNTTRKKRRSSEMHDSLVKNIKSFIPHK